MSNLDPENGPPTKCGYCGWLMRGSCGTIQDHECFQAYEENTHVIVVNENMIATMRSRTEYDSSMQSSEDASGIFEHTSEDTSMSTDTIDELLIEAVQVKRPLWDHTIPVKERTQCKKKALWTEVSNLMGGAMDPEGAKKRWQYLRECYIKARKKMKGYVHSGSAAEAGHPRQSSFRFYLRMQFLEVSLQAVPTKSSLPHSTSNESYNAGKVMSINEDSLADNIPDETRDERDSQCSMSHRFNESRTLSSRFDESRPPSRAFEESRPPSSAFEESSPSSRASSVSRSASRTSKRKSTDSDSTSAELESQLLQYLKDSQPKRDVVDGFLEQLGDILRRLPYPRRRNLQLRLMNLAVEEEDTEFARQTEEMQLQV